VNTLKKVSLLLLLVIACSCSNNKKEQNLLWISSDKDIQWQIDTLKITKENSDNNSVITIFPDSSLQTIDGFGASFNELGWEALNVLPDEMQQQVLYSLFDTINGCGFNLCRMPIGANDYAVNWYSHNETHGDFAMENFSIDRDFQRLIPYIKSAKSINPDLKIWASPWCPPSWMKKNNHYACKSDSVNDLSHEKQGNDTATQFILEVEYLNAYALYFSKFIDEYKKAGIDVYAVHVQNEPYACQNFPSCVWKPYDLVRFIGDYLGPKFQKDNRETEIWLGTINNDDSQNMETMLQYERAQKYITGIGFQWAGKGAISYVNNNYPQYKLMQTESECGDGSNDWEAAEYTFSLMRHYFANGANSYLYWNMILDETGKSQWGWKQNSMISIDSLTKGISYNPEFYLLKHFSSYIKPGATYLKTSNENCLAFKSAKKYVIFYYNNQQHMEIKEFKIGNMIFKAEMEGRSFNTFIHRIQI